VIAVIAELMEGAGVVQQGEIADPVGGRGTEKDRPKDNTAARNRVERIIRTSCSMFLFHYSNE
jgi:hypothetical protein